MRDDTQLSFDQLLALLFEPITRSEPARELDAELLRVVRRVVIEHLLDLASDRSASPSVRELAFELAEQGAVPGGTGRNLKWVADSLDVGDQPELMVTLLADAQTSGGLVFGVSTPEAADRAVVALEATGHRAARIGVATEGSGRLRLR